MGYLSPVPKCFRVRVSFSPESGALIVGVLHLDDRSDPLKQLVKHLQHLHIVGKDVLFHMCISLLY